MDDLNSGFWAVPVAISTALCCLAAKRWSLANHVWPKRFIVFCWPAAGSGSVDLGHSTSVDRVMVLYTSEDRMRGSFELSVATRARKDTVRGDAASKPHSEMCDSTDAEHGRISDGRAPLLGLTPFALRDGMTWEYAFAGCTLAIGFVAAVPALRQVYLWCLKNYE